MAIYLAKKAQIALLVTKKVQILIKYLDFLDIFLKKKALILLKTIKSNQHAIKLQEGHQSLYKPIYSLGLIKLKILKTYIKINFLNNIIWPSKSLANALIFFV